MVNIKSTRPLNTFRNRTQHYFYLASEASRTWYDADGNWIAQSRPPETRERYWLACALYAVGDARRADAIVRKGSVLNTALNSTFDIFHSNIAAALLRSFYAAMADDVRAHLESLVLDSFSFKPGDRQPDYQFHGYNDNMPAKACLGLILGGEYLGHADAVAYGIGNLRQFRDQLRRCGINAEYNSPTYTAVTIHALADIAEHARDEEARRLADVCEQRLWIDVAARFHPEMGIPTGPYSRAYTADLLSTVTCLGSVLWFVLGDASRVSPLLIFDPDEKLVTHHAGDIPFNIAQMCWFAFGAYHVPTLASGMFARKTYPFKAAATWECGDGGADYPARSGVATSYLASSYAVGTSTSQFLDGAQTATYFATYKRVDAVRSHRDIGTVYSKMVIDDRGPGEICDDGNGHRGEHDNLSSKANTLTIASGPSVVVLTQPALALSRSKPGSETAPVRRLSELMLFPTHYGGVDEVIVDGTARAGWSGDAPVHGWIACRRGKLLLAMRPLAYSLKFGPARVTLEQQGNYDFVRVSLYDGDPHVFTADDLRTTFGGFVAEHAGADEYDSLSDFVADLAGGEFVDFYWTTRRIRYRRPAGLRREPLDIEGSRSPQSTAFRYATINGEPVAEPLISIDGVDTAVLPILSEPWTSSPIWFPWEKLEVAGQAWPGAIGDRPSPIRPPG